MVFFKPFPSYHLCSNTLKITCLDLLFANTAFEGYNWPWIENSFQRLKIVTLVTSPTGHLKFIGTNKFYWKQQILGNLF
jgi:hypothetical protein